jgi:hypothetical protein
VGEIFTSKRIAIAPLIPPGNRVYTGAALNIHGIRFLLVMAPPGSDRAGTLLDKATYRPAFFQFVADGRPSSARLTLDWPAGHVGDGIEFGFDPTREI